MLGNPLPDSPVVAEAVVETEVNFSAELELGTGVEAGVEWGVEVSSPPQRH